MLARGVRVKPKGIAIWLAAQEGRDITPKKTKAGIYGCPAEWLCFPYHIYDDDYMLTVIDQVLTAGVGRNAGVDGLVDESLEWSSHPAEDHWADLNCEGVVTTEVYEMCRWMDDNWENRDELRWDEVGLF